MDLDVFLLQPPPFAVWTGHQHQAVHGPGAASGVDVALRLLAPRISPHGVCTRARALAPWHAWQGAGPRRQTKEPPLFSVAAANLSAHPHAAGWPGKGSGSNQRRLKARRTSLRRICGLSCCNRVPLCGSRGARACAVQAVRSGSAAQRPYESERGHRLTVGLPASRARTARARAGSCPSRVGVRARKVGDDPAQTRCQGVCRRCEPRPLRSLPDFDARVAPAQFHRTSGALAWILAALGSISQTEAV